jgi:hypothetical protein
MTSGAVITEVVLVVVFLGLFLWDLIEGLRGH